MATSGPWRILAAALLSAAACDEPGRGCAGGSGETVLAVEGIGLATPESVLHDPEADVYLVSSISGGTADADDDGFVSRISPDGELLALRWIDGAREDVALDAPKGMALLGDELFVADIDTVRIFDRVTGDPVASVAIDGAEFLNDVAADAAGNVYVSDTGGDAIYRIAPDRSYERLATGPDDLCSPNGLAIDAVGTLWVASGGCAEILELAADGGVTDAIGTPRGGLDGLVILGDGRFVVSSWQGSAVYVREADGGWGAVACGLDAPADIGLDAARGRVLVPLFHDDMVVVKALP